MLMELNSDVRGDFVDETPEHLLELNPTFFNNFSVVIGTALSEKTLLILSEKLWDADIPLLVCKAYGMIGYIRIQFAEHTVIESHPDNELEDLRLDRPFPSLVELVDSYDIESMDKKDHSHIPYIIILLIYLKAWRKQHNGAIPATYQEKKLFKECIRQGMRRDEGEHTEEENFEEALQAVNTALRVTEVPSHVKTILEDSSCLNLSLESKPFWIITRAVRDFLNNEGQGLLPLRGAIPDMTADSKRYIELQNVYHNQANKDLQCVSNRVQNLLTSLGKPQDLISESDVKLFCKNVRNLRVIRGRSIKDEYDAKTAKVNEITQHLDNPDSEMVFYVLLRATDRFYTEYNRYPGYFNDQVEPDIVKLKTCWGRLLQKWGCGPISKDEYIHEMCRYGACELHSIAAFMGGCAAHEVIKLVTGQYVPLNNTFIYNAITATSAVFEL